MSLTDELKSFLLSEGASDVGISNLPDAVGGMSTAVSIVVRLSDAVVNEITDKPTHTYFHHYRTVNAFLDRLSMLCGLFLQQHGYDYIPIAASQSVDKEYHGRYSHKKAAYFAGLGTVGKNSLFLHSVYGSRIRLATVFTDAPLTAGHPLEYSLCNGCNACVKACPAFAITGAEWEPGIERNKLFDPAACSNYMKREFQQIGRGAVCGICMRVCPIHNSYPPAKPGVLHMRAKPCFSGGASRRWYGLPLAKVCYLLPVNGSTY
ncbi:MAG: 4Fe-4S double cluster binding domain-containing protein, partial [Bacillota bacterium]|nr:4Fe-4S double cluster binding domain-containing protein [Bacillota bacterium]